MAIGSNQPLTEINLPGGKGRLVSKADNLIAICEPFVYRKCGSLDVSKPYGPPQLSHRDNFFFLHVVTRMCDYRREFGLLDLLTT
jgi:hypothetical protein